MAAARARARARDVVDARMSMSRSSRARRAARAATAAARSEWTGTSERDALLLSFKSKHSKNKLQIDR